MARDRPCFGELALGGNQNLQMGCYIRHDRAFRVSFRIHRNRFRRGRNRQISLLPVPCHMPDLFRHWHIDREEGHVTNFKMREFQ